jgi:hypothetical protein
MLAVSASYDLIGKTEDAKKWREQSAAALSLLGPEEIAAAELLRSDQLPSQQQLEDLSIDVNEKSLLVSALALRFPKNHDDWQGWLDDLP